MHIYSMAIVYTCKYCWRDVIMRSTLGVAVQIFQWSVCFSVESTLLVRWWNNIVNNSVTMQTGSYHNNKMINLLSPVLLYRTLMNTDWLNCSIYFVHSSNVYTLHLYIIIHTYIHTYIHTFFPFKLFFVFIV